MGLTLLLVSCKEKESVTPPYKGEFLEFTFNGNHEEWRSPLVQNDAATYYPGSSPIGYSISDTLHIQGLIETANGGFERLRFHLAIPQDSTVFVEASGAVVGKKHPIGKHLTAQDIGFFEFYLRRPNSNNNLTSYHTMPSADTTQHYYRINRISYKTSDIAQAYYEMEGEVQCLLEPGDGSGILMPLTNVKFRKVVHLRKR